MAVGAGATGAGFGGTATGLGATGGAATGLGATGAGLGGAATGRGATGGGAAGRGGAATGFGATGAGRGGAATGLGGGAAAGFAGGFFLGSTAGAWACATSADIGSTIETAGNKASAGTKVPASRKLLSFMVIPGESESAPSLFISRKTGNARASHAHAKANCGSKLSKRSCCGAIMMRQAFGGDLFVLSLRTSATKRITPISRSGRGSGCARRCPAYPSRAKFPSNRSTVAERASYIASGLCWEVCR